MANQEVNAQLQRLEEQALQLKKQGNILGALEILEEVMEIEKRWYHFYAKACWLYELPEKDLAKMWAVVQEGFSRFPDQRFWYLYLRADLRYNSVLLLASKAQQKLEDSLSQLSEGQKDIASANYELQERPQIVKETLDDPPHLLPSVWYKNEIKDAAGKVYTLESAMRSVYQVISTTKYVFDAENRINRRIDEQEQLMHSEKIRIIEILGFFTAIMAFIILLGNVAFKTTYNEAMPILGGLSLVLILFVTVTSLVTSKFDRYRDILKDVRSWLAFSLIIILGLLVWSSQKEQQSPDALSIHKSQSQSTVEVLNKDKK